MCDSTKPSGDFNKELRKATILASVTGIIGLGVTIYQGAQPDTPITPSTIALLLISLFSLTPEVLLMLKKAHDFGLDTQFARIFSFTISFAGLALFIAGIFALVT